MKYVTSSEIASLIRSIQHGKFFSLTFDRALPKCESCGAKSKKWLATRPEICPKCGGLISYEREALAQTGVHNPANKSIAPKGIGTTFAERRSSGIVGFYDAQEKAYRECRLENIKRVKVNSEEYVTIK